MRLVSLEPAQAVGAILAHSQRTDSGVVRKGTRLTAEHIATLAQAGPLTVAVLDDGDIGEDDAAREVANAAAGSAVRIERAETGRANLYASTDGLLTVDAVAVNGLNAVDPAVTLATLPPFQRVRAGQMVGTVKIIPFAVPGEVVSRAVAALASPVLSVRAWEAKRIGAISTMLPVLKESVVDKTLRVLGRRLEGTGAALMADMRVPHETSGLAGALSAVVGDIVIVFGASAVMDEDDVIPAAIRAAGGRVEHVGMPVDPGNLLVLGELGGRPVIGAPGCARSPKRNGFDWVLDRLLAGLAVEARDIVGMGVGGLLTDTPVRPKPRPGTVAGVSSPAAVVLAAGRSTRMGAANKLLEDVAGAPMIRRVVEAAAGSRAEPVVVVTGHDAERVRAALEGLPVTFAHNPDYAEGLSTSLHTGVRALPERCDAVLVLLGDMPLISSQACDRVLAALAEPDTLIAMATAGGRRGNPTAWAKPLFAELLATEGDAGGRGLIARHADALAQVEIGDAASHDVDTPAGLEAMRRAVDAV